MEEKVFEIITVFLKEKKISFDVDRHSTTDNFELYIGSDSGFIQVEYSELRNEASVCIQFYSKLDRQGNSLYNSSIEISEIIDLHTEIEQLIYEVKENIRTVSKIKSLIDKIQEICDENNLEIDDFITVEYNFEE